MTSSPTAARSARRAELTWATGMQLTSSASGPSGRIARTASARVLPLSSRSSPPRVKLTHRGSPVRAAAAAAIAAAAVGETAAVRVDPRIARALDRLRADGERVPLAALARDAKLGPSHFSELFAREVGLPLRSWQLWARVVRAAASPAPSLAARAADAGFADQAHMARSFRRFLGHPARAVLGARHALAR